MPDCVEVTMAAFDFDIIIAGSGPAGVSTWLHLHKTAPDLAARALVLEKARHPRPKLCGGGVMRPAAAALGLLRLRINVPAVAIHKAEFRYHDRRLLWRQRDYFQVVRRHEFDAALVEAARKRGMQLQEEEPLDGVCRLDDGIEVRTGRRTYRTRALVAADGANSTVRSALGLREPQRIARLIEILTPVAASSAPAQVHDTAVFDFTGADEGLQGYVWDFPCLENGAAWVNRGIYDSRYHAGRRRADLKRLFRAGLEARDAYDPNQPWRGHPERWFDPSATLSVPHVLLVGDAAGVDPFGGEGISFALGYGAAAADELAAAFTRGDLTFGAFRERILTHPVGRGLQMRRRMARWAYRGWPRALVSLLFAGLGHWWR
jgi:menaquinone-9 beta-reductase